MHRWTYEEDLFCCERYVENYIKNHYDVSAQHFIYELGVELKAISEGSLRMKVQNIKQIVLEENLYDSLNISPLSKYSRQCKQAFNAAMRKAYLK